MPPAADAAVEDAPLAEEDLQRPDAIDVFMPPVRMQRFAHLAFGLVDPTPASPASHIRVTSINFTPINHSLKTILKLCKNLLELIFFPSKNILFQPTTSFVHLSFHQYINFSLKYP